MIQSTKINLIKQLLCDDGRSEDDDDDDDDVDNDSDGPYRSCCTATMMMAVVRIDSY